MARVKVHNGHGISFLVGAFLSADLLGTTAQHVRQVLDGMLRFEFGGLTSKRLQVGSRETDLVRGAWSLSFVYGDWEMRDHGDLVCRPTELDLGKVIGRRLGSLEIASNGEICLKFEGDISFRCWSSEDEGVRAWGEAWMISRQDKWSICYFPDVDEYTCEGPSEQA